MVVKNLDVAIVGAGPYGLSVAAHLSHMGVDFRVFGKPMTTWRDHMPKGMLLKSDGFASSLSAPAGPHSLEHYCAEKGIAYHDTEIPVPLEVFVDYGLDFQRCFVPGLDERLVVSISQTPTGFALGLDDGERVAARKVILAVGVTHFAHVPELLCQLGPAYVSHSSAHHELARFRNSDVTVVGAGSSAIDVAALLHESGARVSLVARASAIKFASKPAPGGPGLWQSIRHPSSGLGPGLRSRIFCDWPHLYRFLPASLRLGIVRRHLGPSSPWHMRPRVTGKVNVVAGAEIEGAALKGNRIVLNLRRDGQPGQVESDHVIAATGYRVDLSRLLFLDEELRSRIRTAGSMPILSGDFEASTGGLYFAGLAAAGSFGPLMRFVYGTEFVARKISQHVAGAS